MKKDNKQQTQNDSVLPVEEEFDFASFEIKTLEDFDTYNKHAHRAFVEAKKRNKKASPPFPVKVPDESFHKKVKVKFQRFDQPENLLKVRVRTKDIDYTGQIRPGGTYDLPVPVVQFLNRLAVPIFAEVKVDDGGPVKTETKQVGERSRFSCQAVELY